MTAPADRASDLLEFARRLVAGNPALVSEVDQLRGRLAEPLRIAIAGRAKAGKSTLLNALVGERLAATDAGECTRLVTWYHDGLGDEVAAVDQDGVAQPLSFRRTDGALEVDLGDRPLDTIARLDVSWPSQALRATTWVDTPGLASIDDQSSLRTRDLLAMGADRPSDVDAVIYLIRHLHRDDCEFLDAFLDRSVAATSPVNAVAVLSRADSMHA